MKWLWLLLASVLALVGCSARTLYTQGAAPAQVLNLTAADVQKRVESSTRWPA